MNAYLISGPSGSGKTSVGHELNHRGYHVVHMDQEPGISGWFETGSGRYIDSLPPYPVSQDWLDKHRWLWNLNRVQDLISNQAAEKTFYVGGAHNEEDLYPLFDKRFLLHADSPILIGRLQARGEGNRWKNGAPETENLLIWSAEQLKRAPGSGAIVIDTHRPIPGVTDEILTHAHDS